MLGILDNVKKKTWTAKQIRDLRLSLNLTQAAFADRIGTTENFVWMLEHDQRAPNETLKLLLECIQRDR